MQIKMLNCTLITGVCIGSDNILFFYLIFILGLSLFSNKVLLELNLLKLVSC